MENNAYNRMIAGEVDNIIRNFINYQQKTGKEMKDDSIVPLVNANTSYGKGQMHGSGVFGDILDTVKAVGSIAPLAIMALKAAGKPRKGGKKRGGNIFDDVLDGVKTVAPLAMMALGKQKRGGEFKTVPTRALAPANIRASARTVRSGNGSYARAIGCGAMDSEMFEKNGGSIFGSLIPFGNMIGLNEDGKVAGKRRPGRPKKGGSLLGSIIPFGSMLGLNEDGKVAGKRRPGRPKKGGSLLGSIIPFGNMIGLNEDGRSKKGGNFFDDLVSGVGSVVKTTAQTLPDAIQIGKLLTRGKGRPRKAGSIGVDLMAETKNNLLTQKRRAKKGGNIFDDIVSGVGSVVKATADTLPSALAIGKMLAKGEPESEQERVGEGFLDDVFSGVKSTIRSVPGALKQTVDVARDISDIRKILKGGKKVAKSSKWIEHCKAFAKKHKISFKDAMKDPRCKNSYKK